MPPYTAKQYMDTSRTIAPVVVLDMVEADKKVPGGDVVVYTFAVWSADKARRVDIGIPSINARRNMGRTLAGGFTERESAREMARAEGLHLLTVAALKRQP